MDILLKVDGTLTSNFTLLFVLLDVAVILIAARICGGLALKIGQPRVVGEILAGVILGPSLLGPEILHWTGSFGFLDCDDALHLADAKVAAMNAPGESITACVFPTQARPVLGILGQVALAFFMFLVGLELDFTSLKGKEKGIITVAIGVVVVPIALGFLVGDLLYNQKFVGNFGTDAQPSKVAFSLMMGAMMSVTAFPVMARILQEKGLTTSAMGVVGVAAAAIVTVLMFVMVSFAAGVAEHRSTEKHVLMIGLVALFVGIMFFVVRPLIKKPFENYLEKNGFTSELLAGIVILIFVCAYIAQQLEVSVIVGGFLAGAILPARMSLFKHMSERLADLTGTILLPIFLAFSGLATDFTKLKPEFWGGIAIFLVAGIAGKWLAGIIFGKLGGLTWAEANVVGILMNCRGLLILVVALIALRDVGVITAEMQVGGVLMALVTTMMTGPLFDKFLPFAVKGSAPPPEPEPMPAG